MFKKSSTSKQLDLFASPSQLMCKREERFYESPNEWHNKFYKNVTGRIDEDIFKPLYTTEREDSRVGRPNAPIRILVAMMILKEGCGCSDEQLYELCRFNLLYRRALGLFNLDEQCPTIDSYYGLRRRICKYEEETGENLFEKCFKQLTKTQAVEYKVTGKSIRMDSKLISSNIAWYSRYEIIQKTFVDEVSKEELDMISDQSIREQAISFYGEDAAKTVYRTESADMGHRLLMLGIVIDRVLSSTPEECKLLLRRVFSEQYEKTAEGQVIVRDKRTISSRSLQNPNDPDAEYRRKGGKPIKGYSTNITETLPEEDVPSLITNVQVKGASASDNSYVKDSVASTEEVTGSSVEVLHTDGAYQSKENRAFLEDHNIEFVPNGLQGKPGRFNLNLTDGQTLEVGDKHTGQTQTAIPVKDGKWKIPVVGPNGKKSWRYFSKEEVARAEVRQQVESIPFEERKKRNNVEACMFQYSFHTRNNKTRYRTLIKHSLQAIARCAWINMRRLLLFDAKNVLEMA